MITDPRSLVEAMLAAASTGPQGARARLGAARGLMIADLTLAVSGRRGVGKTSLVNGLLGVTTGTRGLSAQQRPLEVFGGSDRVPEWATSTRALSPFLEGRRVVEVPDFAPASRPQLLDAMRELRPDVLVYVAHEDLRADEVDTIHQSALAWGLGVSEVIVVLTDPLEDRATYVEALRDVVESTHRQSVGQVVVESRLEPGRCRDTVRALELAERYAVARRTAVVLEAVATVSLEVEDLAWSARLRDDLERVALSPHCHVLRERWALDTALSGLAQLDEEMLLDLRASYLSPAIHDAGGELVRASLLRRAAKWQAEASRTSPRAAEVARTVVRSCQLRLAELSTAATPREPGSRTEPTHQRDPAHVVA